MAVLHEVPVPRGDLAHAAGGQPKDIGALDRLPHWGLSLSPDGKHRMYSQRDRFEADLMLVENFR